MSPQGRTAAGELGGGQRRGDTVTSGERGKTAGDLARRLLGDPADAEDVVQEALLQAFLGLQELRAPDRFGAWLAGIVVNLCRMRWRARHDVYSLEDWHGGRVVPGCVVLLKERAAERILPIWVRRFEGNALALQLRAISTPRPMPHDLTARLLEVVEARVEKVTVTSLHENTFYATIGVRVGERVHDVDARPSDALTLALRMNAPIFVAPELFAQARVSFLTQEGAPPEKGYVIHMADGRQMRGPELFPLLDEWHRQDLEEKGLPPETPEREYLSFRSLPWGAAGDQPKPAAKEP